MNECYQLFKSLKNERNMEKAAIIPLILKQIFKYHVIHWCSDYIEKCFKLLIKLSKCKNTGIKKKKRLILHAK